MDTIGNAYFARVIHTEPKKMENLIIITSKFHMPRTKTIFNWLFSLSPLPIKYKLNFVEVSDTGINEQLIDIRIEKEKKSLIQLNNIKNLSQFHSWLYTQHSAYATGLKPHQLKEHILDTY